MKALGGTHDHRLSHMSLLMVLEHVCTVDSSRRGWAGSINAIDQFDKAAQIAGL